MKTHKSVEAYMQSNAEWEDSLILLRKIILEMDVIETVKWGAPVYTINNKNVVGIGAFKSYVGLWFFQGALLEDKYEKLVNAQKDKTVAMRQWRFDSTSEIQKARKLIKKYLQEAIDNQLMGKEIKANRKKPLIIPPELESVFKRDNELLGQFEKLNLTNKREFAEYISDAKRDETKEKRLLKIIPMILKGKGLNDSYR